MHATDLLRRDSGTWVPTSQEASIFSGWGGRRVDEPHGAVLRLHGVLEGRVAFDREGQRRRTRFTWIARINLRRCGAISTIRLDVAGNFDLDLVARREKGSNRPANSPERHSYRRGSRVRTPVKHECAPYTRSMTSILVPTLDASALH